MLFYVRAGRGTATLGEQTCPLVPGTPLHIGRGVVHAMSHAPGELPETLSVHFTATVLGAISAADALGVPQHVLLPGDSPVADWMLEGCREYALRPLGYRVGLDALVTRVLLHVARWHGRADHPVAARDPQALGRVMPAVERMRRHLADPLPVAAPAEECDLSESQFRRVFGRAIGASPVAYLRLLRLDHARLLLRSTEWPLDRIAHEIGYADGAFFANVFRKHVGTTPGRYRSTSITDQT